MTDRQRIRRGRTVSYNPTAAEATAGGAGPWMGVITLVNDDGSVSLLLDVPTATPVSAAVLAAPLITSADATDLPSAQTLANELKADVNIMTTLVNQLRAVALNGRKTGVTRGSGLGQYSLTGTGPQAI